MSVSVINNHSTAPGPLAARWQYKVIILDADEYLSTTRLDTHGAAGWELVGIGGRFEGAQYAYLKRPVCRHP